MKELWNKKEFPGWKNEDVLKPALHALEFTFRFVSIVLSDPRPYTNQREWRRRLESLATTQIELVSLFCEDDKLENVPIVDIGETRGVLTREGSSLRMRMRRCPYTLGLGEPNLNGKPSLNYDVVCKASELHLLTKTPPEQVNVNNYENRTLFTTHQILESWIYVAYQLLKRIENEIDSKDYESATSDCYILQQIWKLLTEIEDLHLLMDPDDFLRLKNQLDIKAVSESESFCFRSKTLVVITKMSKNLRHKVPYILEVEVDPMGGPRLQETAMKLYRKKHSPLKIHLLQSLQAIETSVKKFFYSYKQLLVVVMGSVEAKGSFPFVTVDSSDTLAHVFLEPTYFPSLDGAKTFLGDYWSHDGKKK
ncbi:nematode resistance protein-like HSPRO2 [Tanacetum coccineum]|uniref:Nematode resistance protein-like HSPRO2 n=1 Tax=Tanacetum coccineum TaxID=301880 RepID=A0ABQ5DXE7_9ASTR